MRIQLFPAVLGLLLASGAVAVQAAPSTAAAEQTTSFQDYQFGFNVGQGDVAYHQQMLQSGTITRDQYDEAIWGMRQAALQRMAETPDPDQQDYYQGYYDGLAFA
ncbi:hypothetical protein [Hymenobacter pini]|uniref:hypothetical protein n=1 Tax=Hymenobacter pini TaxID=2880879 RepID=UPI001CF378C2|nr:hypothetical protein [Hymenobacter pini]MCA8830986.1 hypothetical protein [Hymenobacter pini]